MFANEHEIDRAIDILERTGSDKLRYARYLGAWRDIVNANSDGWPYWKAGTRCAEKLSDLVMQATEAAIHPGEKVMDEAEFMKALRPIKSTATRFKLPKPELQDAEPSSAPRI